ncbi:apolipoprotein acyltransferase [Sulfitobacter sp. M57]|uniref:apolipoprotein acyltransferase n=1 Tax=unclassified Sulfitobacter TaxID=196795 RepID=UPI0023E1189C|nr:MULTISPECIES: apolipoprotein acyltransferase [unclassified Sulfitobacter]MDF3413608.1 apolipoprotein acyltransferase [Sulfitobacter sp. KE5]MDF3421110.1 apolipoprotein acyltransferase [Sulfitobacter sp. KE43]MDF3432154.1 apolipoprotein acyltransferase [Sulfitobacter sp. KE42]MDF3457794.1 apolipoprotein acyltransferase [Sulfitobacter sp. S74]MDF3461695.1 apolipoprotein acyltransferase [Sulfitobacter sp. Ks18]
MIVIGLGVIGALLGGFNARKRGGNRKDMAQYAAGFGMAFMICGMVLTVLFDRFLLAS